MILERIMVLLKHAEVIYMSNSKTEINKVEELEKAVTRFRNLPRNEQAMVSGFIAGLEAQKAISSEPEKKGA